MRSQWQIPDGVSPGTWDYVRNIEIASNYDQFLTGDPLTVFDWKIVSHCLPPVAPLEKKIPPVVIEFGCGTGRTLIPLVERGYRAVGVDLSLPMLDQMRQNFRDRQDCHQGRDGQDHGGHREGVGPAGRTLDDGALVSIQANLVELDGLADDSVDHGVCLFSTLGMIRGKHYRRKFLRHVRRIIKNEGVFVLHAHNFYQQLSHPGGKRWLVGHLVDVVRGRCELGDRFSTYRNVTGMFIHSFRRRELGKVLEEAGFEVQAWHRVEGQPKGRMAVGWVVVCR